jgi:hypothetical protein
VSHYDPLPPEHYAAEAIRQGQPVPDWVTDRLAQANLAAPTPSDGPEPEAEPDA